jgi:hypothetical protein
MGNSAASDGPIAFEVDPAAVPDVLGVALGALKVSLQSGLRTSFGGMRLGYQYRLCLSSNVAESLKMAVDEVART